MNTLIEKHLAGTLTANEAAALAQALAENPALADEFAAATRLETELRAAFKEQAHTVLYSRRMERAVEESEPPARRTWAKPLAAAAGIALLAGGGLAFLQFRQPGSAQQKSAPRGKVSGIPSLLADASPAASHDDTSRADTASVKRKLRRFIADSVMLRSVPVSQALSSLESQWKSFDHRDPRDKDAVAFTVAEAVRKAWTNPDDEPRVKLEFPGISLLTSVELIAAQAGLRAAVTPAGVTLEPEKRADDGKPRTWNLPLPAETFSAFLARAGSESERTGQQIAQNTTSFGLIVLPMMEQKEPSWLRRKTGTTELVWDRSDVRLGGLIREDVKIVDADTGGFTNHEEFAATSYYSPQVPYTLKGLPNHAWTESPVDSTGQPIKSIDVLIADAFRVQENQASGLESLYDPTVLQVEASLPPDEQDGYTIDLNLAPEVVEFEGFLNYGEPIQTTGVNALGQSEPVILTDSGITQPVFATRTLVDHPATLTQLLDAHSANTAGITWDETHGTVTARGTLRELRTASAVLAAVRESASAGFVLKMERLEWKDSHLPPAANGGGTEGTILSSSSATGLRRSPGAALSDTANASFVGSNRELDHYLPYSAPGGDPAQTIRTGWGIEASGVHREGSCVEAHIKAIERDCAGHELINGLPSAIPHARVASSTIKLHEGEWLRLDLPQDKSGKAVTFLVTVQPASLP